MSCDGLPVMQTHLCVDSLSLFSCDASAQRCAFANDRTIVTGDGGGRVYILALELALETS